MDAGVVAPTRQQAVTHVLDTIGALVTPPWADPAAGTAALGHLQDASRVIMALDTSGLRSGGDAVQAVRNAFPPVELIARGTNGTQAFREAIDGLAALLKVL